MKKIFFALGILFVFACSKTETSTSITNGSQKFMDKNLEVVTYRNGDVIPQVADQTAWALLSTGA
ncbi:MAG: hypothetical protein NT104_01835, partial [Bacteroidetes bacterium]|nr:hypothetical protein [Bacteroidota bacterium]